MRPFQPLFRNPHVATVLASFWPRPAEPAEEGRFRASPDAEITVRVSRPANGSAGAMVIVHGLEGSSESSYMRSLARSATAAGFTAHRMNIRSCGGTARLCQTLYHAGLTTDIRAYVESLGEPVWLVGYSLGANQALKLAGELGAEGPRLLRGVCGVSAPLDLAACCRALERPGNEIYQWHYTRAMRRTLRKRQRAVGPRWIPDRELDSIRTLWEMDDQVTAPAFGFKGARHYYSTQSAIGYVGAIRVPTLLVQAEDDPMIPFEVFRRPEVTSNPAVRVVASAHGGHIGFLERPFGRLWVDDCIVDWARPLAFRRV